MRFSRTLGMVAGCLVLMGAGSAFGELVYNGDFSSGATGFASSYTLVSPNTGIGQYGVVSNPNEAANPFPWNSTFTDFTDNSGSGLMFVANGSTSALLDPVVWAQAITVEKDKTYDFSFWGAKASPNSSGSNVPALTMSVNGTLASTTLNLNSPAGTFSQATGQFTATSDGPVFLRIRNGNFNAIGNDFALDDISVTVVPEPSSLALLGIGSLVGLGVCTRRRRKNA